MNPKLYLINPEAVTKLTNLLFTNELQRRLDRSHLPITCISLHPGEVNTFASRTPYPFIANIVMSLFFLVPEAGAYTSCFAAAARVVRDKPDKYKGVYLMPVGVITQPSNNARKDDLALELWETTERILKEMGL